MPKDEKNVKQKRLLNPANTNPSPYVRSVLRLYTQLPFTPVKPSEDDRFVIQKLQRQRIPLSRVHAALLLGSARRVFRADSTEPLLPIRSIRYFLPVVEELSFAHVDAAYIEYLRQKLSEFLGWAVTLQSITSGDRDSADSSRQPAGRQLRLPW